MGFMMAQAASKKQYRFMMAILHGKNVKEHSRGNPPKSIASKYRNSDTKSLPESKDNDKGGTWGSKATKKAKTKVQAKRTERKKRKAKMRKSFEQYYNGRGAGCIVVNNKGQILVGQDARGGGNQWMTPGGHIDPGETFEQGAKRELFEEAGITAGEMIELGSFRHWGNDSKTFLVTSYEGKPHSNDGELKGFKWMDAHVAADQNMRACSLIGIKLYLESHLRKKKSLKEMVALEQLEKNILRGSDGRASVLDVSHGEALRLVGNGTFRMLRQAVDGMTDEDFRDVAFDDYKMSIRKHMNDVYSGRINHGGKLVHQFTNKSLPQISVELMSVFEWYLPEDEPELAMLDEEALSDDVIEGGMHTLVDNYRKHNLANIYTEMENIREEIRHDNAVDLIQAESKIMKLFDKLERYSFDFAEQHNKLCDDAGDELERLEAKLLELQGKIDELEHRPTSVEAYSSNPANSNKVHDEHYCYLSKPSVTIEPSGKIKITFAEEWTSMDRENFLSDMRAKAIK